MDIYTNQLIHASMEIFFLSVVLDYQSPAVSSLHQLTQLILSRSELLQTLLVAEVSWARPLQEGNLVRQLAGSIPQPLDGHVQVLIVFLLQPQGGMEDSKDSVRYSLWMDEPAVGQVDLVLLTFSTTSILFCFLYFLPLSRGRVSLVAG